MKRQKKRKEPEDYTSNSGSQAGPSNKRGKGAKNSSTPTNGDASASNTPAPPRKTKNTAVYVTRLPSDTTAEELAARFGKCGVLEEDDDGDPKVKLYARDDGSFSGDALVVYFKEESVALAVAMLDEAELRIGQPDTVMTVSQAEFGHKGDGGGAGNGNGESKPRKTMDKKKASKRLGRMQKYVYLVLEKQNLLMDRENISGNWKTGTQATSLGLPQTRKMIARPPTRTLVSSS